jgi:hypothetical protein
LPRPRVDRAIEWRAVDNVTAVLVQVISDRPISPKGRQTLIRRRS